MIVWYKITGSIVTSAGSSATVPTGAALAPPDLRPAQLVRLMQDAGGALIERPLSPVVTSAGTFHTIENCPAGTVIEVADISGDEIMAEITSTGQTEVISLPDPGEYQIRVAAPLPALPTQRRIIQS
ncbi:hypothetical protein [Roseobacter sp. OBYS 0001]|uniref:hypothetical protein n=1 Tax=Roseobacter sp. OBYS 0001 TaxID=882651 RepID=UPI001BBC016F|nr:hypothetical protein [Roseobacter sp. OBYS 0001]GIT85455.1 hypothetical protein ROBYS_04710 [Roseobacter sp. OBYS 0001]